MNKWEKVGKVLTIVVMLLGLYLLVMWPINYWSDSAKAEEQAKIVDLQLHFQLVKFTEMSIFRAFGIAADSMPVIYQDSVKQSYRDWRDSIQYIGYPATRPVDTSAVEEDHIHNDD